MATLTSAPSFTQRVPLQFFVPDNTALNITGASVLQNNPVSYKILSGSIGKSDPGLNGTAYYRGTGELPPFSIQMQWKSLGYNDYLKLAQIVPYYVNMVSFRNLGFYGRLALGGPDSSQPGTADVIANQAIFFPLTPSDYGGAQAVSRIAVPPQPTVNTRGANTGFIPSGTALYYWVTFSSDYGETLPSPVKSVTAASNDSTSISWTWPTTTSYCSKATIYVATVNDSTQAKLLADVPNGLAATWTDFVGTAGVTVNQAPPTANTAYRGSWSGGVWFNES